MTYSEPYYTILSSSLTTPISATLDVGGFKRLHGEPAELSSAVNGGAYALVVDPYVFAEDAEGPGDSLCFAIYSGELDPEELLLPARRGKTSSTLTVR